MRHRPTLCGGTLWLADEVGVAGLGMDEAGGDTEEMEDTEETEDTRCLLSGVASSSVSPGGFLFCCSEAPSGTAIVSSGFTPDVGGPSFTSIPDSGSGFVSTGDRGSCVLSSFTLGSVRVSAVTRSSCSLGSGLKV